MIDKQLLMRVILEQHQWDFSESIPRSIHPAWLTCEEIIVISGIRRCGKSFLMQQIRQQCDEKDFFINFEDERLLHFEMEDFQLLEECLIELYGTQRTWYLDEIQNIAGWERFVRRLYNSGHKVFITGSNANMLSREFGTHLTGRYIQAELYPFSFVEYLVFKGFKFDKTALYTTENIAHLQKLFKEYLTLGGFPAYLKNRAYEYLSTLYESILYKDVLLRNQLTSEREMLELMNYLVSNGAQKHSYASLGKIVGIRHPETIKNYLKFLEDTYLIFVLYKYSPSLKNQIVNAKKVYLIDNGLMHSIGFHPTDNLGPLVENLVLIELKRRGLDVYYHAGKAECDFVIRRGTHIVEAYQVTVSLSDNKTRAREIAGLLDAANEYHPQRLFILTLYEEDIIEAKGFKIEVLPVWKWLLAELKI